MAERGRPLADEPIAELVARAVEGDERAWEALVVRLHRVVWKSVNMMTFDRDVRDDAFAATWMRLAERLESIREPEKLPGWLATTACNEVRQILRHRNRHPIAHVDGWSGSSVGELLDSLPDEVADHADRLLADEQRRQVRAAFERLDDGCRELLTVLVLADPPVPYDEAAEQLGRPIGSLGPTRRRCLEKMNGLLDGGGA